MGFPKEIRDQVLIACKRHCVLCECEKGVNVECHHIIPRADGGPDTFENCIPLCFDCHSKVGAYNPKHPKGNKFSPTELKIRRDSFYQRVANGEFPKYVNNAGVNAEDKILYQKIKELFQSPNLMYYLTEYDLGNDFDNRVFYPFHQLLSYNDDPDYEFVDYEIESYKRNLFDSVNSFLSYKATNTFPTNIGTQAIYTWKNDDYDFKESIHINIEFNNLATAVWDAYKAFISICKRKLN